MSHKDRIMKLANIRYKGAAVGKVKSERLFDDFRPLKKLKLENGDSQAADFSSVAPVRFVEYELQEKVAEDDDELSQIKVKFIGNDVFGGLHELASMAYREDSAVIDPRTVPGWLTGEEGMKSGKVRNGKFYEN